MYKANEELVVLHGWYCDNALTKDRIDSWVTSHAVKFFLGKASLEKLSYQRKILKKYDVTPYSKIETKKIVDPNNGKLYIAIEDSNKDKDGLIPDILEKIGKELHDRKSSSVFLLYGPPGTGKSTLVEYIAKQKGWDLVRLSPSDFIVDGMEHIEYKAREIFSDLCSLEKCVILLDEMDSLLKNRTSEGIKGTVMEYVVPAFLPKLQELCNYAKRSHLSVFFVTNFLEKMDPAIKRPGRIDHHLIVLPYSYDAKANLAMSFLYKIKKEENIDITVLETHVQKEINSLPNYMVFRDIEKAVNIACESFKENPKTGDYSQIFQASAIDVFTYDYDLRKGAGYEFAQFLLRLANVKDQSIINQIKGLTFTEKEETIRIFTLLKKNLENDANLTKWKDLIETWINEINR